MSIKCVYKKALVDLILEAITTKPEKDENYKIIYISGYSLTRS